MVGVKQQIKKNILMTWVGFTSLLQWYLSIRSSDTESNSISGHPKSGYWSICKSLDARISKHAPITGLLCFNIRTFIIRLSDFLSGYQIMFWLPDFHASISGLFVRISITEALLSLWSLTIYLLVESCKYPQNPCFPSWFWCFLTSNHQTLKST